MRTVDILVHGEKRLQIFVGKHKCHFELWVAGPIKGRQILLDHHLTHDDLEARLGYAKTGDLDWRNATQSDIPTEKHENAIEMEKTIKRQTFYDYDDPQLDKIEALARQALGLSQCFKTHCSVTKHLDSIALLAADKEGINEAKKALLGQWSDGVVTLTIKPGHKLQWSCKDRDHPLNVGERVHEHPPDWWDFNLWELGLMNDAHKCGTHVGVLRVDERELHLNSSHPHQIAHVLHRDRDIERHLEGPDSPAKHLQQPRKRRKVIHASGKVTPLLCQLEQAISRRNPALADRLKDGLPESNIRTALSKAGVFGEIEPVVQLYSWRNGTVLHEGSPMADKSFFPMDAYQFIDLEAAISQLKTMSEAATRLREMFEGTKARLMFSGITGSLFPFFTDGAAGIIAVDLKPGKGNRVVTVEFESVELVREAYASFKEFIKDAIRANKSGDSLSCFQSA
jgi:hypothetical protein